MYGLGGTTFADFQEKTFYTFSLAILPNLKNKFPALYQILTKCARKKMDIAEFF